MYESTRRSPSRAIPHLDPIRLASLALVIAALAWPSAARRAEARSPEVATPAHATQDGGKDEEDEDEDEDADDAKSRKKPAPGDDEGGEHDEDADDEKGGNDKNRTEITDPDLLYVREHLEDYLNPSSIKWNENDTVTLSFDFREKDENQTDIFTQSIGSGTKDRLRWTFDQEEFVVGGSPGVRLSNQGVIFLRAWFEDDVEAEIEYLQYINFQPDRHMCAVVFGTPKRLVGANFGSQTTFFLNGRKAQPKGEPAAVSFDVTAKIKLAVHDGVFYGERNGRKTEEREYKGKSYESGQIGILWGGSISAIVPSFTVTGKIDAKKTAEAMKADKKKSSRGRR